METVEIESTTPALQGQVATLEHAPPHIMEPWRIELHTLSLRRTNAALEHEAPKKCIRNVNLPQDCASPALVEP